MPFNSVGFLVFFAAVLAGYYTLPAALRRPLLLVSSYVFYMAGGAAYGLLLLGVSLLSWGAGLAIERWRGRAGALLWAAVGGHLAVLLAFKYAAFFARTLDRLGVPASATLPAAATELLLPLGISFYVFQSLSYVVDVYRRQTAAERSLPDYLLYISFFPQLVAGPIERSGHLLPQVKRDHAFDARRVGEGLALVAAGLFKKAVLADTLAVLVAAAFRSPATGGFGLLLGAVLARYMIYCDIAGYTDIARGCGRALGFDLSRNFARPFAARNIAQYWQRWHMTLSGWFRDYVFFSLAAGPLARLGAPALVLATFLLLGLWHGAAWSFVAWGLVNGLLMIGYHAARRALPGAGARVPAVLQVLFTFVGLVCVPTVFVVSADLGGALDALARIFGLAGTAPWTDCTWAFEGRNGLYLAGAAVLLAGLEVLQHLDAKRPLGERLRALSPPARAGVAVGAAAVAAAGALLALARQSSSEFVYFRF